MARMHEALLIVDIDDTDGWGDKVEDVKDEQRKSVAQNIVSELWKWRDRQGLIVFTLYPLFSRSDYQLSANPNDVLACIACEYRSVSTGRLAGFLDHQHGHSFEPVFFKDGLNAFSGNRALAPFLRKKGTLHIFLAGCVTSVCVHATAQGAIQNGFKLTVLEKCIYPGFKSKQAKDTWVEDVLNGRRAVINFA